MKMTVKEFKDFCCTSNIVLKDSYTGKVYTKIDNYLNRIVTGFYPCFDMMGSNGSYSPWCKLKIVAWIQHSFEEADEE